MQQFDIRLAYAKQNRSQLFLLIQLLLYLDVDEKGCVRSLIVFLLIQLLLYLDVDEKVCVRSLTLLRYIYIKMKQYHNKSKR